MEKTTPRLILIKLLKTSDKEQNEKATRGNKRHIMYKETNIRMKPWVRFSESQTQFTKLAVSIFTKNSFLHTL